MKLTLIFAALTVLLAACTNDEGETYFCLNGPDLVAVYDDASVTLFFNDETVHNLTRPDPSRPNFYSNAQGVTWATGGNDARLDFDRKSYLCDAIS